MIPKEIRAVLPGHTADTWEALAPILPKGLYLAGGTGLAVHIKHRQSRDLDFFYHHAGVDLDAFEALLASQLGFAVARRGPGTLNGVIADTNVQFLHADEGQEQRQLDAPGIVAGLPIAGVRDILAMKLAAVTRGELRDYFDLLRIETDTDHRVEQGLSYFVTRFRPPDPQQAVLGVIRAIGYLDDVEPDVHLPASRGEIAAYWQRRQPEILSAISREGL